METIQAIRSRRSIRKYQPKPVPHEVIEQIVADAAYAPSWKNTQIARYVLVEDRTTIDKMAEEMVLDFKLNERLVRLFSIAWANVWPRLSLRRSPRSRWSC